MECVLTSPVRGRPDGSPACTTSARFAECERALLVACTATLKFPVGAFAAAPKTTGTLVFTATLKGLTGFERTPPCKLPSVTCTTPFNPFWPLTEMLRAILDTPCMMEFHFV